MKKKYSLKELTSQITPENKHKEVDFEFIYHHDYFGHLTKEDLDIYFDFIGEVLYNLNGFDIWVAENIFNENDNKKYDKEIIKRYELLLELRDELEDKLW